MPLELRKRLWVNVVKQLGQTNSSATSTPNENVQNSSKRELIWNSIFGPTPERSTRASTLTSSPSATNFSETDTTTSMHTASVSPIPPVYISPEDHNVAGNNSIPKNPSSGELLQQEASDLWTKAYNELSVEYKQDLGHMDKTGSDEPERLESLKQLLGHAMRAKRENITGQWKVKWGGKEINVREKAEKLVGWITKFKEIGDIVSQYDPVHAALPWAGVRFILILVIGEQQNLQHAIIAMERIAFLVSRCTVYEKLYLVESNGIQIPDITKIVTNELRRALIILYTGILRALSRCMRVFKGNVLENLKSPDATFAEITTLDGPESVVNSIVQAMESCYNSHTRTQNQESFDKLTMLLRDFSSIVSKIDETVTAVYERIQEDKRIAILRWLSVIPYQGHHDLASEDRVAGTGQWLFQRKEFKHWQQSERSEILWLHGIPGAGKTKLVSATIDYLKGRKIAYFYCKRDEEARRDRHTILLSLIKQLACPPKETAIFTEVLQVYNNEQKNPSAREKPPVDACLQLLSSLLGYYEHAVIVLDALDECSKEPRDLILGDLLFILQKSKHPVKAFISSRHSLEIEDRLRNFPNISIEAKDNAEDIENYVKSTLTRRIEDQKLLRGRVSAELRQRIEEVLQRDANGMFLWVDHQIRELCNLSLERDIQARLGKLPKDLTGVYNEIMDSIMHQSGSCPEIATRALKWMAVSQRPLEPHELIAAAELNPASSTTIVPELDIDQLIHFCGGLLLLDKQLGVGVMRFSHLSVQEYLETESMNKYWDIINAQRLVMEACLWILQCPFPPESVSLYTYTACHWFRHCRLYQDLVVGATTAADSKPSTHTLDVPSLKSFLASFDQPTTSYEKWKRWLSAYDNVTQGRDLGLEDYERRLLEYLPVYPAFAAALGGLGELISWLWLTKGIDVNVRNEMGAPLLHYAIRSGSAELVERMITMGADIDAVDREGKSTLMLAVGCNSLKIVLLLLDRGANINFVANRRSCGAALGSACGELKGGFNVELVSLLLDRGADINLVANGSYNGTALGCAALRGSVEVVSLLLDRGADINAIGGYYGTALGCAASSGSVEVVSLLLDRGADIHIISGKYGTALGCAAWRGHVELVSLLLDKGADINAVGGDYGTALGCACGTLILKKHVKLVSLLLDRGADIHAVGGDYGTALGCAVWRGHVELVSLLLDRGADIHVIGGKYGTTLGCTCPFTSPRGAPAIDMATLLLQRGVDVNILFGGQYGTALGVSASLGRFKLARLFMKHGANPDLTNDDGMNARALAESAGHLDIVHLLDSWDGGSKSISRTTSSSQAFPPVVYDEQA